MLDGEAHVPRIAHLTTLAGHVHERLTGRRVLGVGDASGVFPIDATTGDYDAALQLDQDTSDRRRTVHGPDHQFTLSTAVSLANDLRALGAFRDSVALLRDTLASYQGLLGDEVPDTLKASIGITMTLLSQCLNFPGLPGETKRVA